MVRLKMKKKLSKEEKVKAKEKGRVKGKTKMASPVMAKAKEPVLEIAMRRKRDSKNTMPKFATRCERAKWSQARKSVARTERD